MQIIIVQSEIEAAIRNYINSQLNVKDGMRIDIDLSATRGADGFKATIDIVPSTAPTTVTTTKVEEPEAPAAAPAPTPAPSPAPKVTKAEAAFTASTASVKVEEPKGNAEPEVVSTPGAVVTDGAAQNASAEPSSTEPVVAEVEAAPAAPARSLFAGLKKPVNA